MAYRRSAWFASNAIKAAAHSAAYTNFIARTSGLNQTHLDAYAALLDGLTTDGIFNSDGSSSFLDVLYVYATDTQTNALLNLVSSSYGGTTHGTVSFSADHGYTGDGSSFYIDTGWQPTNGPNFTQNSASFGVYCLTSNTGNSGYTLGEAAVIFDDIGFHPQGASTFGYLCSTGTIPFSLANNQGNYVWSRPDSGHVSVYQNGSVIVNNTADTGSLLSSANVYMFCVNVGSAAGFYTDAQSAAWIGGGMTSTQAGNMASRLNTYMTTFGINVY